MQKWIIQQKIMLYTISEQRMVKAVDFVITHSGKAVQALEVQVSDHLLNKSLLMFKERYNIPSIQLVKSLKREYKLRDINLLKT